MFLEVEGGAAKQQAMHGRSRFFVARPNGWSSIAKGRTGTSCDAAGTHFHPLLNALARGKDAKSLCKQLLTFRESVRRLSGPPEPGAQARPTASESLQHVWLKMQQAEVRSPCGRLSASCDACDGRKCPPKTLRSFAPRCSHGETGRLAREPSASRPPEA